MTLPFEMKDDAIYFVPLGGCGIFGANMALYGYQGQWIMMDCGMGFADETMPGVDILLPDPSFAASLGESLLGIVLTHGHEDHIGAINALWPRLKKPLYATPFTAARIQQAVSEQSWGNQARINVIPQDSSFSLGPFDLQYIRMAHSIPEANAVAVTVKDVGTLVHTGDWKIDPDPVVGNMTDVAALQALGESGVLAVLGDSTNAMVPGHSGSEGEVGRNLAELFSEFEGKIVVSCFSTNIARLKSIHEAAERVGRHVCLIGRSLWKADDAARQCGYLTDLPPFLEARDAAMHPPEKIVYVCTGSQGEPRAALARIAGDDHPDLSLGEGDVVIFSSRAIPGNERAINRIKNRLYADGVEIITDRDAPVHVSGHPYRDELKQVYAWLRPKAAIPVHGEMMQMEKHAHLARECGVEQTAIPHNGMVMEITPDGVYICGEVDSGILAVEGGRIVPMDHDAILIRRRMMYNGSAVVTVVVDKGGDLQALPMITALGLLDENCEIDTGINEEAVQAVAEKIRNLPKGARQDDDALAESIRITARRFFAQKFDRKPQTRVHLVRV